MAASTSDQSTFELSWQSWHEEHEAKRASALGFLSITGLHWLSSMPERFTDVPGAWCSDENGVRVELEADEEIEFEGTVLRGSHRFAPLTTNESLMASFGPNVVEITSRNGSDLIRPRHRNHATLLNYRGTPTYPPSLDWQVRAHYTAFEQPRNVSVDATIEGLHHEYVAPGRAEFELKGRRYALTLFASSHDGFIALFRDETSGATTYGACRTLDATPPDPSGIVLLDFNRATNPPCAYTPFATCPLPPPENRLAVRIEAGEKLPHEAAH